MKSRPMSNRIEAIYDQVCAELLEATNKFGPFNSTHEGYAVIKEEVDELWDLIKAKGSLPEDMRAEAVQIAAMAIRFIIDCIETNEEPTASLTRGETSERIEIVDAERPD